VSINLLQRQQHFLNSIHGDQDAAMSLQEQLSPCADIDPARGVAIYRNNYRGALLAHLAQSYRVCCQLVGDEAFNFIARKFVAGTPSLTQDINLYGSEFVESIADLVDTQPGWQRLNYLPEVAKLEHLLHNLYYTASSPPVDLSQLPALMQSPDPDTLILSLPDQLCLLATNYPVVEIWKAHKNDEVYRLTTAAINLDSVQQQYWLMVRNTALQIEFHPLNSGDYHLLSGIGAEAMTLSQTANHAAQHHVELDRALPDWLQRGWLLFGQNDASA
jgi:hypothetical protein